MYSLYLHIPFCVHRCAYCDFNTYAGQEEMIPAYVDALTREIEFVGERLEKPESVRPGGDSTSVHTVFFGGGTPSLLSPPQFESVFKAIRAAFPLTPDAEISIEANPGTVAYEALCQLRMIGINRISYGVQSANTFELKMLERAHNFFDVIEAVTSARRAGFDNLNLDLIYGLPEQTIQAWQTTLKRILDLHPEHISAYALTLEHGTPFGRWASKGLLPLPDPDLAAEMYEWAGETFEANGYVQYEISNWAKHIESPKSKVKNQIFDPAIGTGQALRPLTPDLACRHNLQYWRGLPYLAFGAGAHGYASGYRYSNVLRIKTYIDRITNYLLPKPQILNLPFPLSPAAVDRHKQTIKDDMSEFMMTGLRLTQEGVSENEFQARFGASIHDIFGAEIEELMNLRLLERSGNLLRLSKRGRLLGNQVFIRFVD